MSASCYMLVTHSHGVCDCALWLCVCSHPASWGGMRLVSGGALHVGALATRMVSFKMPAADGVNRCARNCTYGSGTVCCSALLRSAHGCAHGHVTMALVCS